LDQLVLQVARMFGDNPAETLQDLSDSLMELLFARIAPHDFLQDRFELLINIDHFPGVSIQHEHNKRASAAALTKESVMLNRNFHHIEHFPGRRSKKRPRLHRAEGTSLSKAAKPGLAGKVWLSA